MTVPRESLPSFSAPENALIELYDQPNPIWTPLPGPQTEAWLTEADECFYGGAAGSGKSALLIGLATTAHRKSVIFRREYRQLRDLIDYSRTVIGANGRFNSTAMLWRLPGGRSIEFGAAEYANDVQAFQG